MLVERIDEDHSMMLRNTNRQEKKKNIHYRDIWTVMVGRNGARGIDTEEPGYNDIGFYDTSPIASDTLRYQLISHC